MKHIFYVHSHITFLVAKQYIVEQHFAAEDCIFFTVRNYQVEGSDAAVYTQVYDPIKLLFAGAPDALSPLRAICRYKQQSAQLEQFVRKVTKEDDFMYYLFYTASHMASLIVTMPQCKGYYIIEEGISAYNDEKALFDQYIGPKNYMIYKWMVRLFPRQYLLKDFCFSTQSDKYQGTIATCKEAFSFLPGEKIILQTPFGKTQLDVNPLAVLSIDSTLALDHVSDEDILCVLNRIKQHLLKSHTGGCLAYKFHPYYNKIAAQRDGIREKLKETFSDSGITLYEIPGQYALENILNMYRCDFYTDYSSVGIYASAMGCQCFSYAKYLCDITTQQAYVNRYSKQPETVKQMFIQI